MIELYLLEQTLRSERALLDRQAERAHAWAKRDGFLARVGTLRLRRRLALALLALAEWLDPRPAFGSAHVPARPALNGSAHRP